MHSEINIEKMLEFIKSYCLHKTTFENLYTTIKRDKSFIHKYKEKFMRLEEIFLYKNHLIQLNGFYAEENENNWMGLDGFSLNCKLPKDDRILYIKDFSRNGLFRPIIDLANFFLDVAGVDKKYRFIITE